jgi:hypothetical protein
VHSKVKRAKRWSWWQGPFDAVHGKLLRKLGIPETTWDESFAKAEDPTDVALAHAGRQHAYSWVDFVAEWVMRRGPFSPPGSVKTRGDLRYEREQREELLGACRVLRDSEKHRRAWVAMRAVTGGKRSPARQFLRDLNASRPELKAALKKKREDARLEAYRHALAKRDEHLARAKKHVTIANGWQRKATAREVALRKAGLLPAAGDRGTVDEEQERGDIA